MASSFNNKYANVLFKCANLKACKSVKFRFNPWRIDAKSIRFVASFQSINHLTLFSFEECHSLSFTRNILEHQIQNVQL